MYKKETGNHRYEILHIAEKRIIIGEDKIKEVIPDGKDHKRHDNW